MARRVAAAEPDHRAAMKAEAARKRSETVARRKETAAKLAVRWPGVVFRFGRRLRIEWEDGPAVSDVAAFIGVSVWDCSRSVSEAVRAAQQRAEHEKSEAERRRAERRARRLHDLRCRLFGAGVTLPHLRVHPIFAQFVLPIPLPRCMDRVAGVVFRGIR